MPQGMDHCTIDRRIPSPALLVGRPATIADHGEHETMPDAMGGGFISRKPCNRTDRSGRKDKPIAVSSFQPGKPLGQMRKQRHSRAVVVGERGMTDVSRKQT